MLLSDLSTTLKAVVSQRLLKAIGGGRVPAVEVLLNTTHIAELIDQGRLNEIRDALANSMTPGAQTFDRALIDLLLAGKVTREDALTNADSPTNLLWMLENRGTPHEAMAATSQTAAEADAGTRAPARLFINLAEALLHTARWQRVSGLDWGDAPDRAEALLLRVGHQFQQHTDWHLRQPEV